MIGSGADGGGRWWVALTLIVVGVAFLVRQPPQFELRPDRWWALLMVVPLAALLRHGRPRGGRAIATAAVAGIMAAFLLTPSLGAAWPLVAIAMGVTALFAWH
jgi:drug/metabolite transporter (DMT)-like permease